eukprot:2244578-Rhodomonas_salina.3
MRGTDVGDRRCAWCGEPFSILAKAVQCPTDRYRPTRSQAMSGTDVHVTCLMQCPAVVSLVLGENGQVPGAVVL